MASMITPLLLKPTGSNNMRYSPSNAIMKILIGAFCLTVLVAGVALINDAPALRAQTADDTSATGDDQTPPEDAALFAIIDRINAIKLDTSVFSDPAFLSLKDISTVIPKEPIGRDNPFLPIPGSAVQTDDTTSDGGSAAH